MHTLRVSVLFLLVLATASAASQPSPPILFETNRHALYKQEDLWRGLDVAAGKKGWDANVYDQYIQTGKLFPTREIARARSLHDEAISSALHDYLIDTRRRWKGVIAVMGNADEGLRCSESYRQTAELGYALAREGYLVTTGGGPGEMEAANLGAYLANEPHSAIDAAITIMRNRAVKTDDPAVCRYSDHLSYSQAAFDVIKRFPAGGESLGVSTWFFGHEPPNRFATVVAKYFSNAVREEVLLQAGSDGVVYTEGGAGMRQEIFQKASHNAFASFCYISPMVFLGTKEFGASGLYSMVRKFAAQALPSVGNYQSEMTLVDEVGGVIDFLRQHPPRRVEDSEGVCRKVP